MAAIGAGWVDGAWVFEGWVDGAWAPTVVGGDIGDAWIDGAWVEAGWATGAWLKGGIVIPATPGVEWTLPGTTRLHYEIADPLHFELDDDD